MASLLLRELMESLHTLTSQSWQLHQTMGAGKTKSSFFAAVCGSRVPSQEPVKWDPSREAEAEVIERRLCVTLSRSKEALRVFGEFDCLRLVLDEQSPLASFFIDLFSHLEFLLLQISFIADRYSSLQALIRRSLRYLQHVTSTCRLLYAACKMLPPTPQVGTQIADEEFKRKGQRQGRQFSSNLLHSRMQHMAFVYLDQPGCSRVNLAQELGEGASATVYKGIFELPPADCGHPRTGGQDVAVKMFKDSDAAEYSTGSSALLTSSFGSTLFQSMQQMTNCDLICENQDNIILAELEKLVVAKHPNIVTPMGYIGKRTEGDCGLVMELMDESLYDYLEKVHDGRVPPLKEVDMLDLMLEIARGMRFLHECELIHLDLKPSNVLLRFSDGQDHPPEVKLADLGLTTLSSLFQMKMDMCHENRVLLGTSCYMAPEIRSASSQKAGYDDKVDVFSFGTTCFNILLGNPDASAFSGSVLHFYAAIKTGEWKQWVQGCNPFVVKLIGRCWEMEPSMRPTFATLCVLLQQAIECYLVFDAAQFCSTSSGWLKKLEDDNKLNHLQIYAAISAYRSQRSGIAVDLEIIERSVLQFESHVRANADPISSDKLRRRLIKKLLKERRLNANQKYEKMEVRTFMKWKRSLEKPKVHIQHTIMDRFFDDADPLTLIKKHAYLNLIMLGYDSENWRKGGTFRGYRLVFKTLERRVGDLSDSIQRARNAFDFSKDAANAPLGVDTSIISLLVSFWRVSPLGWPLYRPREW